MQLSNPAMGVITRSAAGEFNFGGEAANNVATLQGTTTKSIILVLVTCIVGYLSMNYTFMSMFRSGSVPTLLMYGGIFGALILAFITIFKPNVSPFTAPAYAVFEGVGLGCLSAVLERKYPGIVSTAVLSTFAVVVVMLALWKFKVIVPTARFRSIIMGATFGICLLYLGDLVMGLFGFDLLPSKGPVSIGISLVICTVAAFSLILDFDNIEQSVQQGLPKYFEFYCAFSLLVTICWLYIEILNLLSKRE